jgi:hypothetical protein
MRVAWGWEPDRDMGWRYRRTLSEEDRELFDNLSWMSQLLISSAYDRKSA